MLRVGRQYGEPVAPPLRTRDPRGRWKKSLAGGAVLFVLGAQPALAATINVRGACTLDKAITTANTNRPVRGCVKGAVGRTRLYCHAEAGRHSALFIPLYLARQVCRLSDPP